MQSLDNAKFSCKALKQSFNGRGLRKGQNRSVLFCLTKDFEWREDKFRKYSKDRYLLALAGSLIVLLYILNLFGLANNGIVFGLLDKKTLPFPN